MADFKFFKEVYNEGIYSMKDTLSLLKNRGFFIVKEMGEFSLMNKCFEDHEDHSKALVIHQKSGMFKCQISKKQGDCFDLLRHCLHISARQCWLLVNVYLGFSPDFKDNEYEQTFELLTELTAEPVTRIASVCQDNVDKKQISTAPKPEPSVSSEENEYIEVFNRIQQRYNKLDENAEAIIGSGIKPEALDDFFGKAITTISKFESEIINKKDFSLSNGKLLMEFDQALEKVEKRYL